MSNNYDDQNQQYVDQNQEYAQQDYQQGGQYDDYYGGQSMEYSATQVENYEQGYDANAYANYYDQFLQTSAQQAMYDQQVHAEQYQYYVEHKEELRGIFPKKKKIVRWEEAGEAYNSLEAAEEFMDLLEQMQDAQAQSGSTKNEYDDIE